MSIKIDHLRAAGRIVLAAVTWLLVASAAFSAVPSTITYQARLTEPVNGNPLSGTYNMRFRIFPDSVCAGLGALWEETHNNATRPVTVDGFGMFEVLLGEFVPLSPTLFPIDGSPRYLEVEVNGEVLCPRKVLNSVPYTFAPMPTTELWQTDGTNVYRTSGNVGIGTTNPNSKLDVRAGEINSNGPSVPSGGFTTQYRAADWDIIGQVDEGANDKLAIGGYRASQWKQLRLATNGSERLRISDDGKIGIGTINTQGMAPSAELHITGRRNENTVLIVEGFSSDAELQFKYTPGIGDPSTFRGRIYTQAGELRFQSIGMADALVIGSDGGVRARLADVAVSTQGSGVILRATDGSNCYRLTVNNAGTLTTTLVSCP